MQLRTLGLSCVRWSLVALSLVGCASPARIAGRWVLLTSGESIAVGQADQPSAGGPLHLLPGSPAAGACLPEAELETYFGASISHESEGDAPGADAYVRWYGSGDVAVRVRLDRCDRADRLRVVEIAIATR